MVPDIWQILVQAQQIHGASVAVVEGDARIDYAELGKSARHLASWLRSKGIDDGDRVAIVEDNTLAFVLTYFACAGARAICVPVNTRLSSTEIERIFDDCTPKLAIVGPGYARSAPGRALVVGSDEWTEAVSTPGAELRPSEVGPDDPAHLYYTSGTTGRPKGVVLTHRNVCVHALGAIDELEISSADVWAHVAPMFHLADAWATFAMTMVGGRHVMQPRFDAEATLSLIAAERITISNLIPTMLNLMVKNESATHHDYTSLRVVLSGGAPIAPRLVETIMETFGCTYVQTYGMTETSPYLTLSIPHPHMTSWPLERQIEVRAKTGRPFKAVDLQVVDGKGREVRADGEQVGEIRVRGETVTPGYWNAPELTEEAFTDGWLMTGDLAVRDDEGFVDIVDRKKDMIITGGENVYCIEVENALYTHPAVLEAAVVGVRDETWGEVVKAVVAPRPGHDLDADGVVEHVRSQLAAFKVPRLVEFVEALPRTGSGKIDKKPLK